MATSRNFDWERYERQRPKVSIRMSPKDRALLQLLLIESGETINEFFMNLARPHLERIERAGNELHV